MRRLVLALASLSAAGAVLSGCASSPPGLTGSNAAGVRTTPPAVQRSVPAGVTVTGAGPVAVPAAAPQVRAGRTGRVLPHGRGPGAVVAQPDIDGCNRDYGAMKVCVPMHAPGGGPMTCAYLDRYGFLPLLVSRDRQGLTRRAGVRLDTRGGHVYITGCSP